MVRNRSDEGKSKIEKLTGDIQRTTRAVAMGGFTT